MMTLVTWLAAAFYKLAENIYAVCVTAFYFVWSLVYGMVSSAWDALELPNVNPVWITDGVAWALPYTGYVNQMLPLSEGATLIAAYWTFYVVYVPVRILLRHLPAVGG